MDSGTQGLVSHQLGPRHLHFSPLTFSDLCTEEIAHYVSRPGPTTVQPLRAVPRLSLPSPLTIPPYSHPFYLFPGPAFLPPSFPASFPPPSEALRPCPRSPVPCLPVTRPPKCSPVSAGVRASAVLDVCWIRWESGSLSASLAMAAPLSQPGTRTERPAGPGSTGPGGEVKVEAEGRDAGWHLPLPAGRAASRSGSPGQRGLGADSQYTSFAV